MASGGSETDGGAGHHQLGIGGHCSQDGNEGLRRLNSARSLLVLSQSKHGKLTWNLDANPKIRRDGWFGFSENILKFLKPSPDTVKLR